MTHNRRPCLTMVLAAIVIMVVFGCLCGLTMRVIYRPPFLTWQHGGEFMQPVTDYLQEQAPSFDWRVRMLWVKEYTDTCSVVRVAIRSADDEPEQLLWVRLFREADNTPDWLVDFTESDAGLAPVLAWGTICREAGGLPFDLDPFQAATLLP